MLLVQLLLSHAHRVRSISICDDRDFLLNFVSRQRILRGDLDDPAEGGPSAQGTEGWFQGRETLIGGG